jgi:hypothetical protein
MLSLWTFCPSGHFYLYVSGRFVPTDVWSYGRFVPTNILSFRTFCPSGRHVPRMLCIRLLCLRTFVSGRYAYGRFVWTPLITHFIPDGATVHIKHRRALGLGCLVVYRASLRNE